MGRNKPRTTTKRNGHHRCKVCSCCGYINCDSMFTFRTIAGQKLEYRKAHKLCIACGHKECTCKNKGRK